MSIDLDGTKWLTHPAAPIPAITAAGHTMSAWATRRLNTTMSIVANGLGETADSNRDQLQVRVASGVGFSAQMRTLAGINVATTPDIVSGVVFESAVTLLQADGNLIAYQEGVSGALLQSTVTPIGMTEVNIGSHNGTTPGNQWVGNIAEVGIWNRELNAQEIQNLSINRYAPSMIPNGLVAYWPLLNDFNDAVGTFHMSEVGGVVIDPFHPPGMIYPGAPTGIVTSRGFANMDRQFLNMRG